jgi:hypothetical protein
MPQDANCPKCKHMFPVTEARQAFTVPCPKCEADLTIEFKKPATPPEAGQPPYDLLVKPGALPGHNKPITQPKRKSDEDDEPKRKGGSAAIVLVSGLLGLLFVVGGLGVTGWFLFTQIDMTETVSNRSNNNNNNKGNNNQNKGNNQNNNNNNQNNNNNNNNNPPPPPKKEPTFDLRPVRGGLPAISPPPLTDNLTPMDLPGKVGAVAVGGGGRYIVMHFPQQGQLGILDVSDPAAINFVKADTGDSKLAAGLSYAVTFTSGGGGIFRVYSLPTGQKLYDASSPMNNFASIAMGSRTNGPMLGVSRNDVVLMEVTNGGIKPIEGSAGQPGHHHNMLRAAPDGTAFTTFDGFENRHKVKLLTEVGRKWKITEMQQMPFPGTDGNFYGNGAAISRSGQQVASAGSGVGGGTWIIPAISGNGGDFVRMSVTTTGAKAKRAVALTIHANRDGETPVPGSPTMTGPEIDTFMDIRGNNAQIARDKAPDQHLFYSPEAKLLVILSNSKDKLILRKTIVN